ncbi:hypothetical protein [Azohydromonas australica]|uniref:hypothetical protein n=1 Tax=Azohydromonas australica TaxID=364039 RepID=UPI000402CC05|nr:hypothetical protein [Azohydromonas australica]
MASSTVLQTPPAEPALRCRLVASGSYCEQFAITPIEAQPGHFNVRVASWLDNACQPLAYHTRYRTTLDVQTLARLHQALGALLEEAAQAA